MKFRRKVVAKALLLVVSIAVLGWIVMRLWNWTVPTLFADARALDYPHAIGVLVLCRILFGGWRGHGGCRHRGHWQHWQHWQQMTQQERERFRHDAAPSSPAGNETGV